MVNRISITVRAGSRGGRSCGRRVSGLGAGMPAWLLAAAVCSGAPGGPVAAASSAPFAINAVDAGGIPGGSLGAPITWTGGAAFNPASGGNVPPSAQALSGNAVLAWDSYLAMDPIGPSTPADSINPVESHSAIGPSSIIFPTATPTTPFGPSSLSGVWFNVGAGGGFLPSGLGPSNAHRMFIAQITLRPGSSVLTTDGVLVNIKDAGTADPAGALGALRFGLSNASTNGGQWGQAYYLDWVAKTVTDVNATFKGGTSYAVYVMAVPGPGAAAALLGVGVCAARRLRATTP